MSKSRLFSLALMAFECTCSPGAVSAPPDGDGVGILFIGNSHTAVNDVPGLVAALADSAGGEHIAPQSIVSFDYALIDFWNDGRVQREIARRRWAYVVLQQGWTPAGVCRDTLRLATKLLAAEIRKAGARPALFQTWPPHSLPGQFQGSIESYRLAAHDIDGLLFPVAEAWQAALHRDSTIALYGDALHANAAGSYLAALVIYARLFDTSPVGLPARIGTRAGIIVDVPVPLARVLQEVAAEIGLAATPDVEPTAPPVITSRC